MPPSTPPDVDPRLAEAVRRTYVRPVDEQTAARHVAAMAEAARETGAQAIPSGAVSGRPRRRGRAWRPALATGLAVLTLPAGLAVAGVDLPDPLGAPYDVVGIELPNQDEQGTRAPQPAVPAVPAARPGQPATPATPSERSRTAPGAERRRSAGDDDRPTSSRGGRERPGRRGAERGERRRGEGEVPDRGRGGELRQEEPARRQHDRREGAGRTSPRRQTQPGRAKARTVPRERPPRGSRGRDRARARAQRPLQAQPPAPEVTAAPEPAPDASSPPVVDGG